MQLGVALRTMGEASRRELVLDCACAADEAGLDELYVVDHLAIPPDDAEGSNGRYLDPLTTLAHLAGRTRRIGLGTGVLILPYRPALPTAKAIATIQELSGERLRLGVGVGWMKPEFRALGVDRRQRGRNTDRTLELIRRCFEADDDVVEENGQPFYFRPRPACPPIFVGGAGPHALSRAVRYGDGWMPMIADPDALAPQIDRLQEQAAAAGRPPLEVVTMGRVSLDEPDRNIAALTRLAEVGVTRFVAATRYTSLAEFQALVAALVAAREGLGAA